MTALPFSAFLFVIVVAAPRNRRIATPSVSALHLPAYPHPSFFFCEFIFDELFCLYFRRFKKKLQSIWKGISFTSTQKAPCTYKSWTWILNARMLSPHCTNMPAVLHQIGLNATETCGPFYYSWLGYNSMAQHKKPFSDYVSFQLVSYIHSLVGWRMFSAAWHAPTADDYTHFFLNT